MKRTAFLLSVATIALTTGAAGTASAQETPAQARARATTQSLNSGPGESRLGSAPPTAPLPAPQSRPRPSSGDAVTDLLNQLGDVEPSEVEAAGEAEVQAESTAETAEVEAGTDTEAQAETTANASVADTNAPMSALPPLPLGYYVRDGKACDSVWPGDGDLAWLSSIAFTIDFGGCDPSTIEQLSDTMWEERQACRTELGADGPPNIVNYEISPEGGLITRTRLGETALGRQDNWAPCAPEDVPPEARFAADDPGRYVPPRDDDDAA
jgi:hypothetical protein